MNEPRVAIIYLTYNGKNSREDITRCFRSLELLDYPRERVEVICVENPSPHGASWPFIEREWMPRANVSFPALTLVKNEKDGGYSGANNVGLDVAIQHGCEYVFLLNQDCDIDAGFLRAAVARAERDQKIALVQSLVMLGNERNLVNSLGNRYHFLGHGYSGGYRWTREQAEKFFAAERQTNPDLEVPYVSGAAVLVRVAFAEKIGLFDSRFYMYHEDIDASFNARVHGWKSVIEPSSVVYHYYEFAKSIKKFYWMERNRFVVLLSYYEMPTLVLLSPIILGVELISLAFAVRGGWWREKLRSWAFFWHAGSWRWVLARRKKIQRERLISDREFLARAESRILFQEGDASGSFMQTVANPLMTAAWRVIYFLIRW